jgi:pilus assembly protein CpaD
MMMRKVALLLLASAIAGCTTPGTRPTADRGVESVNQPVLTHSTYVLDLSAPGGVIPPQEVGRLNGWFQGLDLGYGDSVFVDGAYADTARSQVAVAAGTYGMMVLPAAPVTEGVVPPDTVRVVVSRTRAEVPNCPNWSVPSQPNMMNRTMSNYGCAVNSNYAAMVADPQDLFHGREGAAAGDAETAAKAVSAYRQAEPTGKKGLQDIRTKKDKQ